MGGRLYISESDRPLYRLVRESHKSLRESCAPSHLLIIVWPIFLDCTDRGQCVDGMGQLYNTTAHPRLVAEAWNTDTEILTVLQKTF